MGRTERLISKNHNLSAVTGVKTPVTAPLNIQQQIGDLPLLLVICQVSGCC